MVKRPSLSRILYLITTIVPCVTGVALCVAIFLLQSDEFRVQQSRYRQQCEQTARMRAQLVAENFASVFNAYGAEAGDGTDAGSSGARKQAIQIVNRFKFDPHGYAWLMNGDGVMVASPAFPPGTVDAQRDLVIQTMLDTCRRSGGGFVQYLWPLPGETKPKTKTAYVARIPRWDWFVVVGVYTDDVDDLVRANAASLGRQLHLEALIALGILVLITGAGFVIARMAGRRFIGTVESLQTFFRRAAIERVPVTPAEMPFSELEDLADLANAMLEAQAVADERWRKSEEQLRHAQKMESVARLVGGVVHDFNNVLTAIIGYADLVAASAGLDDDGRECIGEIQAASSRAASLTKQLLAFSRKQPARKSVIDVNAVVTGVERMCTRIVGESITLETELRPGICPIFMDASQLEQVLINLVVNSRDAITGPGRIRIETDAVVPTLGEVGGWVILTVSDTGSGMSEEVKRHLFEPYYTTKGAGKGTGLGLSIISGIIHQSQGFIDVDSRDGEGTTFRIHLPCHAGSDSPMDDELPATADKGHGERVLVVDDDPAVRAIVTTVLSSAGYRVANASSGAEAIALLGSPAVADVRCVVVDIVLADMCGDDVIAHLRARGGRTGVVRMSGYPASDIPVPSNDEGFLPKPFSAATLLAHVRSALDRVE